MVMRVLLAVLMVLLFLPGIAQAATVYGNVYDLSLNKAEALVEIELIALRP